MEAPKSKPTISRDIEKIELRAPSNAPEGPEISRKEKSLRELMDEDTMKPGDAIDVFIGIANGMMKDPEYSQGNRALIPEEIHVSKNDLKGVFLLPKNIQDPGSNDSSSGSKDRSLYDSLQEFGCLLFTCITGTHLVNGTEPLFREFDVPEDLANVIAKCMETDANQRYQAVAEVRDALQSVRDSWNKRPEKTKSLDKWMTVRLVFWIVLGLIAAGFRNLSRTVRHFSS